MREVTVLAGDLNQVELSATNDIVGAVPPRLQGQLFVGRDRIIAIDADAVSNRAELSSVLASRHPEAQVKLTILEPSDEPGRPAPPVFGVSVDGVPAGASPADDAASSVDSHEEALVSLKNMPDDGRREGHEGGLVAFDTIDGLSSTAAIVEGGPGQQASLRSAISKAIDRVERGNCVLVVVDGSVNPLAEVEVLGRERRLPVVTIDFGVKLRRRISKQDLTTLFQDAMQNGKIFLVIRASKSLSLLSLLASELEEIRAASCASLHPNSRMILCSEPHPHFPRALAENSCCLRVRSALSQSRLLFESVRGSVSTVHKALMAQSASGAGASGSAPRRKVRISTAVDIVNIEPREVFTAADAPSQRPSHAVNVAGTVRCVREFAAMPNDKFFGVGFAGDTTRFALASSLGNLYIVDDQGCCLLEFHAHDAALWDVSFLSKYFFITGGEDATAIVWQQDEHDQNSLVEVDRLVLQNDVYTTTHTANGSAFAVGGLMPKVTIRGMSGAISEVALPTSLQAMCAYRDNLLVGGGGDGSVFIVDAEANAVASHAVHHAKKTPTVAVQGDTIATGSFDTTVRLIDARALTSPPMHKMKFQNYVTGLHMDQHFMSACVGDNLYLWDVRKLNVVLGGQPQAWRGLSRGIKVVADSQTIVTASPDGYTRFWRF